jgi:hypothetical protein
MEPSLEMHRDVQSQPFDIYDKFKEVYNHETKQDLIFIS